MFIGTLKWVTAEPMGRQLLYKRHRNATWRSVGSSWRAAGRWWGMPEGEQAQPFETQDDAERFVEQRARKRNG